MQGVRHEGAFFNTDRSFPVASEVEIRILFSFGKSKPTAGATSLIKVEGVVSRFEPEGISSRFKDNWEIVPLSGRLPDETGGFFRKISLRVRVPGEPP